MSNDSSLISTSASSSSSSPLSHLNNNNNNNKTNNKSMEEVWKDISISSLPNTPLPHNNHYHHNSNNNHHINHHPTPTSNFRGMILQDFLNCTSNNNNLPVSTVDHSCVYQQQHYAPTNALNLNDDLPIFEQPHHNNSNKNNNNNNSNKNNNNSNNNNSSSSNNTTTNTVRSFAALGDYDPLGTSSVLPRFGNGDGLMKKRSCETLVTPENGTVDRRHKRMIKNRESAARSRARKQAYITELELEVAHLAEENARLRKQQQQLLEAPPSHQLPKSRGLHRTSTAPF